MHSMNSKRDSLLKEHQRIKSRALTALFSDDDLMDMLVLKGGNALNLIYNIAERASIDLDFSIQSKIAEHDMGIMESKFYNTLKVNFLEDNLQVIDFKFYERPKEHNELYPEFWGGYRVEFKIIDVEVYHKYIDNPDYLSRSANTIGEGQLKTFIIDISKYEFCEKKIRKEYMSLNIFVYSPEMIAIEKLRAICQQMPEYIISIKGKYTGACERAKDFFDIYIISERIKIDLLAAENLKLLDKIFSIKKVPVTLLTQIELFKEFHSKGYDSLKHTVPHADDLKPFEFYFNYVVKLAKQIKIRLDNISSI